MQPWDVGVAAEIETNHNKKGKRITGVEKSKINLNEMQPHEPANQIYPIQEKILVCDTCLPVM